MFSFNAAIKEELNLPLEGDGEIWEHNFRGEPFSTIHRHPELEINLTLQGTASYLLEGARYELGPGSLVWLFPEQNHILIDQSTDYQMWIGVFKPDLINRVCGGPKTQTLKESNPAGTFCKQLDFARSRRLVALFKEIEEAASDTARYNAGLGYLLLLAWEAHLASDRPVASSIVHPAVKHAIRILQLDEGVTAIRDLAGQVGLSSSRLSHLFKEQTGLSLVDFQNNQCLRRFLDLYQPDHTITMLEAALQAGFGSYPQFYRIFKRHLSVSPAAYFRNRPPVRAG